ncbi:tyrosine-type recombinase/integrase [Alkalihalobacillus sp. NPDC078783]
MASAQKRGKTWQYTISRKINGKAAPIRKGGFRTKKEALAVAAEVETELKKGLIPQTKDEPLVTFFETWLDTYKPNISKNTRARYEDTLRTLKDFFKDKPLQQMNKRDYQYFLNEYGKNHARSSSKKLNSHIRACVKDAIDEGLIRSDFTRKAVLTGEKAKRAEEKHLHFEESQFLLNYLYSNLELNSTLHLILLALTSGMRFGELVGLQREDFNFFNNTINVNKTWGYTKKSVDGFGPTKNDQSIRNIKMDGDVMNAFKAYFNDTPENIHKLVFYSSSSKYKVISNTAANNVLKKILSDLDIEPISIHGLRHTHASVLLYEDVSIYYVAERLGHSNTDTTISTYAHIVKELRTQDEEKTISVFKGMRRSS